VLPSLLIQRDATTQASDATEATRISSRSPMCLTPAVVTRTRQAPPMRRGGVSPKLPFAEQLLLETSGRVDRALARNRHARRCAPA
jgi:hypothetical protein